MRDEPWVQHTAEGGKTSTGINPTNKISFKSPEDGKQSRQHTEPPYRINISCKWARLKIQEGLQALHLGSIPAWHGLTCSVFSSGSDPHNLSIRQSHAEEAIRTQLHGLIIHQDIRPGWLHQPILSMAFFTASMWDFPSFELQRNGHVRGGRFFELSQDLGVFEICMTLSEKAKHTASSSEITQNQCHVTVRTTEASPSNIGNSNSISCNSHTWNAGYAVHMRCCRSSRVHLMNLQKKQKKNAYPPNSQ